MPPSAPGGTDGFAMRTWYRGHRLGVRDVIIAGCVMRSPGLALFAPGDGLPVLRAASTRWGAATLTCTAASPR